ncbi:AI-2E family transporter [Pseudonocardia hydrocarbonoxydans]|uniref:AI-2E family transporter n=1 Tax=Pseudonocardia hydrocarbonoxydans TaxID=76726 RepID=A0A4Y3WNH2_9PSEU|nr:AI-2E family transporter [Pseudonocardia hydrocarbonoxydans]GEC20462.1 AI-2E family transporter [Pseudonocardia hydrocarbonoxydans]
MTALPRAFVVLVGAAAAVVLAAGVQATAWLIGPAFLAFVIVIVVSPVEGRLRGLGVPRWLSVAALVLLVYAVVLVLVVVLVVSVAQLATILPRYAAEADALVAGLTGLLGEWGVGVGQVRVLAAALDLGRLVAVVGALLAGVTGLATNLVFLLSLMLFLSIESTEASARMAAIAADRPHIADGLVRFAVDTRRYLVVTTVFGLLVGAVDTIALALLGVPLALLWGLLAFLTNYIPYVGFWLGVLPPALLALLVGGPQLVLAVLVIYSVVNFLLTSLAQPRFIGNAVGLSISVTFLGLAFWGWMLGLLGAVLAVPLTLLVKTLLVDCDPRASWAQALLGSARDLPGRRPPVDRVPVQEDDGAPPAALAGG